MWRYRKSSTSCPISLHPPPPLVSSLLPPSPALTCELWTPSSSVPGRQRVPGFDWCQSSSHSFLPFDLKGRRRGTRVKREGGRSLQNRFSNAIGGGCQRSGVAGEPFMPFHLKKPKGSWRVHSVCVPLLLLMGSAPLLAAAYRSPAFYFMSGARAKKPSSDLEWKKNAPDGYLPLFFSVFPMDTLLFWNVKMASIFTTGYDEHRRYWQTP